MSRSAPQGATVEELEAWIDDVGLEVAFEAYVDDAVQRRDEAIDHDDFDDAQDDLRMGLVLMYGPEITQRPVKRTDSRKMISTAPRRVRSARTRERRERHVARATSSGDSGDDGPSDPSDSRAFRELDRLIRSNRGLCAS